MILDVNFAEDSMDLDADFGEVHIVTKYVGGEDFKTDESLIMKDGVLCVNTVDEIIEDDSRPVTSGAVYGEFSKAVALLKTI